MREAFHRFAGEIKDRSARSWQEHNT